MPFVLFSLLYIGAHTHTQKKAPISHTELFKIHICSGEKAMTFTTLRLPFPSTSFSFSVFAIYNCNVQHTNLHKIASNTNTIGI